MKTSTFLFVSKNKAYVWEQRKLGSAINVRSGKDYKHLEEGDVPVYGTGGYMLSVSEALENTQDAIGIGRKGTIDKPFVLKAPFWTVDTLFYCIPKGNNFLGFLYPLFQSINWKLYDESTGVPSLSKTAIEGVTINLTSKDEQYSIGEYFESVDNLITLHQRKYDALKSMKKTLLSKMFPKNGEDVPEIRFKEFTDAWEQRKLGEEVQIVMGQSPKGENYTDNPEDYILVQGNADMKEGKVFPRVWTTQVTKQAYKGDIILSVRAPVGDVGKTDYDVVIGRGVAAVKGNEFFYQLLGKLKQDGYWAKSSTGSTFDSINSNEIKDAKVTIPDANEQLFIGNYFKEMDNLITLHQRKLDELKNMKKTLLQQMFV